jgi:hypothetical protein
VYDRENSGVPEERVQKKRKMMARFRCGNEKKRENKYWIEGCSEMIERERKERGEKPNEGGREIR